MNITDLPALPSPGAVGPEICAIMRLYIAIARDLPASQVEVVNAHIQNCQDCAREYRVIERTTKMVSGLEPTTPSARVDQAVMAAIAAHTRNSGATSVARVSQPIRPLTLPRRQQKKSAVVRWSALVAVAAALVIAVVATLSFVLHPQQHATAFTIPANVSWNSYVLHHKQTMKMADGETYSIETYHNLAANVMNVETRMDGKNGKLDVIMVKDNQKALGMDMVNNVAQWQADEWGVDDSIFDLPKLRADLQANRATYLGKEQFDGQDVYCIRDDKGLVILLNMQYQPVNVLRGVTKPGTGQPIYDQLQLLPPSKVPASMWDMNVPDGFNMGQLPPKPE